MSRIRTVALCGLLLGLATLTGRAQPPRQPQISAQEGLDRMGIVGYADHMSVQTGDAVKFMVSSRAPRYRADIVRLIHGDANAKGPGIKETVIDTAANGEYVPKPQTLPLGSYVTVPDNAALRSGPVGRLLRHPRQRGPHLPAHSHNHNVPGETA